MTVILRIWLIVVLLCPLACTTRDTVVVSGAVQAAGTYPHEEGWTTRAYIELAGGFAEEADSGEVSISRLQPDIEPQDALDYRKRFNITGHDAGALAPGDQISVPFMHYTVRMDTVRLLKNLELAVADRTYRISNGHWVPGWTERGVVTGVAIGRGEILQDFTKISMFHYLHIELHPGMYHRISAYLSAGPVVKTDILEDASEIHTTMFSRSAHRVDGRVKLPPAEFLNVQAGIWLAPKSRARPGPGMRKRRYGDRREWTTYGDGRQRMSHPDGRVEKTFPGGSRHVRYRDGRTVYEDERGNVETRHPDGREVWVTSSGNQVTSFPDGRREYRKTNGDVRLLLPDGTDRTIFAEGIVHTRHPDDRVEVKNPDGSLEVRYPDGRIQARTSTGHEITIQADGTRLDRLRDGTVIETYADGRKLQHNATGELVEVFADGKRKITYGDGTEMIRSADGHRRIKYADETLVDLMPDGREIRRHADGRTLIVNPDGSKRQDDRVGASIEIFPDGTRIETHANGSRMEMRPDGTWLKSFADPYAYRGIVRSDLVDLLACPDEIAPGERVAVSGAVSDTVNGMELAVFELPHGDVLAESIRIKRGMFKGSLRLRKEGYYRLQILVEVGVAHRETSVDRLLRVGSPAPLDSPTLSVGVYPGMDEAADHLIGSINESRTRIGRERLRAHPWLAKVAEYRVSEMLALRYFSHVSPIGKNASVLARSGAVRFSKVGENIGQGPSVEDVQEQLMLSAGHRRNILGRDWTDVGVVAVTEGETIWVVQVFGQR